MCTELAVEVAVGVFGLGLPEDGVHHDIQLFAVNLELCLRRWVEALFSEKLGIANQHGSQLTCLLFEVVRCNLIQAKADLLGLVLLASGSGNGSLSSLTDISSKF